MVGKILLVDDSIEICNSIVDYFQAVSDNHFEITVFNSGSDAMVFLKNNDVNEFNMVYLDIMLPGASGFDICREIRSRSECPIIFLTALGTEDRILKGYSLGADDYMVKPFSLNQLYAKTLSIIRRTQKAEVKLLTYKTISMNVSTMTVTSEGEKVELPFKEYFLLRILLENPEKVFTRDQLLDMVWNYDFDGTTRVVDNHMFKLRKALGPSGKLIKSVIGRGYKLQ